MTPENQGQDVADSLRESVVASASQDSGTTLEQTSPPTSDAPPTGDKNHPSPLEIEMEQRKIAATMAAACGMATGNAHDLFLKLSPARQLRIAELVKSDKPGNLALIRHEVVEHNCEQSKAQIREAKPRVEKG